MFNSSSTLTRKAEKLPNFPWLIGHQRVLVPKDLILRFDLPVKSKIVLVDGEQLELPTELPHATKFSALERHNWHRDNLFSLLLTLFNTSLDNNEVLSETQVSLFATVLLSQSFGYFSGPDKKLYPPDIRTLLSTAQELSNSTKAKNDLRDTKIAPELHDVRPDAVSGFFNLKTLLDDELDVVSLLPDVEDLCMCLAFLSNVGFFLGTNEVLLPCCVAEYKGSDNLADLAKLDYEMDRLYEINKLVWRKPPEPYGIYINGHNWQIRTLAPIGADGMRQSVVVWTHSIDTVADALFVAAVIYRFGAYLLETFKQLKPDWTKLIQLVRDLLKERPKGITRSDWEKLLENSQQVLERMESHEQEDTDTPKENTNPSQNDVVMTESPSHGVENLFNKLRGTGYSDFKLLFKNETSEVYETQKDNKMMVIKVKEQVYIEREAKLLRTLSRYGVVHLYATGVIENSDLGYLLEHLKPIPTSVNSTRELQDITRDLLGTLAAVHGREYIHRDIKPQNVMMNKKNEIRLIDFDCAIHQDDTEFDVCYGTDAFKPPELNNTKEPYGWTPETMRRADVQGSVKSDSYSAALICASLMYNIPLTSLENIRQVKEWASHGKLAHVATPNAVELFHWMLVPDPKVRLSATQALYHNFLQEFIPKPKTEKKVP